MFTNHGADDLSVNYDLVPFIYEKRQAGGGSWEKVEVITEMEFS